MLQVFGFLFNQTLLKLGPLVSWLLSINLRANEKLRGKACKESLLSHFMSKIIHTERGSPRTYFCTGNRLLSNRSLDDTDMFLFFECLLVVQLLEKRVRSESSLHTVR